MISVKEAMKFQQILIEEFGGTSGIRDLGALESAINRPYATFNNTELYPNPVKGSSNDRKYYCKSSLC